MARERQRVALEAIPRVLSVLGSYPIRPRRPSPARLCGHPPFWIGRFLRARSFLSKALPSPLALTPGGVEHPWLGSSTGTSNRLRMSWRLCRHWLRSATRDPLFDRSSPIGPGKNLGCNHISSHRLVDCQGSDRKSTRLNSSHRSLSRMPSSRNSSGCSRTWRPTTTARSGFGRWSSSTSNYSPAAISSTRRSDSSTAARWSSVGHAFLGKYSSRNSRRSAGVTLSTHFA